MRRLSLSAIRELSEQVLLANGLAEPAARSIADVVTRAEADACRSHGLYRIPGYVAGLRSGRVDGQAVPRLEPLRPGLLRVDGARGFAPPATDAGREALVAATRSNGIAAMAVVRAHHFSALWADLEPIVALGLVCWCFVVGQSSVAPHGGTRRLMGTNPIAFGWPRSGRAPFIFDFATSAAARGEVELKRLAGQDLPSGWAIDPHGLPTNDPAQALAGALLPFGGHKGSALSMMVELIAGPLIGEMTSRQVQDLKIADGGPPPGGQLFIAFDPSGVTSSAGLIAETFFGDALAQPGVRLPSTRRHEARRRSATEGVEVDNHIYETICALML
ncbi:MAG: Ldh family oxidoreductase [Pseudomonadota bacterium]